MRWPWQRDETQGEPELERFDDVLDDDERDPAGDEGEGGEEDEEPELDDAQRAYLEREAQKRVAAAQAAADAALEAERARHRAELVEFARTSSTTAQPTQQQQETVDPYAALGERPDPSYEPDEAREWDRKYRAVMKAELLAEMQPQFQALQQRQATSAVDVAVARTRAVLEEEGLGGWADIEGFEAGIRETLLRQDMSVWDQPEFLLAAAGSVKRSLKAGRVETRPADRSREDARARAEAQNRGLDQFSIPRDVGRAAPDTSDPTERRMAEISGMTVAEWRAAQDPTGAAIRKERERRKARTR